MFFFIWFICKKKICVYIYKLKISSADPFSDSLFKQIIMYAYSVAKRWRWEMKWIRLNNGSSNGYGGERRTSSSLKELRPASSKNNQLNCLAANLWLALVAVFASTTHQNHYWAFTYFLICHLLRVGFLLIQLLLTCNCLLLKLDFFLSLNQTKPKFVVNVSDFRAGKFCPLLLILFLSQRDSNQVLVKAGK